MGKRSATRFRSERIARERFDELTRPILGLPVSHTWLGYGSALFLELGQLRRFGRGPRSCNPKGQAGVMIECGWRVERARSVEFGTGSGDRRLRQAINRLKGPRVSSIELDGRIPELVIGLSDRRWVRSFMDFGGQPHWTLFLVGGGWLTMHRGTVVRGESVQTGGRASRGRGRG
jgi:hypothetical protein